METKEVTCKKCATKVSVTNTNEEKIKVAVCPQCKSKILVNFSTAAPVMQKQLEESTTVFNDYITKTIGCLEVNGKIYSLQEGINTIGRKATSSDASIQIETSDKSMSRLHAKIEVLKVSGGYTATISCGNNTNRLIVYDKELRKEIDKVLLKPDVSIIMGNEMLYYRIFDEERTQYNL